jgi:hypothetical protein
VDADGVLLVLAREAELDSPDVDDSDELASLVV